MTLNLRSSAAAPRAASRVPRSAGARAIPEIRRTAAAATRCWSNGGRPARSPASLIDTSPDLREQLLDAEVDSLDAVLLTHEHADHTHGIDDLRGLFIKRRRRVDVYVDEATSKSLRARFGYCFQSPPGSEYPPIVTSIGSSPASRHRRRGGRSDRDPAHPPGARGYSFLGLPVRRPGLFLRPERPAPVQRGGPGRDRRLGRGCARYQPHPSHFSVDDALAWIERIKPARAILTNLHSDLDYDALRTRLPPNVEPGFDGLTIEMPTTPS